MSEAKFKEGRWVQCFANGIVIQTESTGYGICKVIGNLESDKANANLIACAPEMYAMLDSVRQCLEWGYTNAELADNLLEYREGIANLLAKARGEA
jgi:hypothetical protein